MKLLLLSILTFFAPSLLASSSCYEEKIPEVIKVVILSEETSNSDCEYVKEALEVIQKVSALTSFKAPINLVIHERGSTAHFDMGHSIEMSKSYQNDNYTHSREANLSILAHEYAHAILKEELRNESSRLKFFYKKMLFRMH